MIKELDIHGMTTLEAKIFIEKELAKTKSNVKEIKIIHGHRHGNALKKMVRNRFEIRSNKIKRRKYTINQGETILELY
ncbi:MAG: Smr/MutS family protein [Candidatus Izimaplasma sp.]|nr:Smr/MutS family protein [Candidatus Izimaplasma bacterium]